MRTSNLVMVSIALVLAISACGNSSYQKVTKVEFGEDWPFTVEAGTLKCESPHMAIFIPSDGSFQGQKFAVNGTAQRKYRKINPIWRDDPKFAHFVSEGQSSLKINIGSMIDIALKLCS